MLFDNIDRTDETPALNNEPKYSFLNRSARPIFRAIRSEIERWFSRYPGNQQAALRSRFKSTNDNDHHSAFFELYLHEMLLRLGYKVVVNPKLGCKNMTPDFWVQGSKTSFYLEARVISGLSEKEAGQHANLNTLYDVLNRMDSGDFYLRIRIKSLPTSTLKSTKIRAELEEWLSTLDPDNPPEEGLEYTQDDFRVVFLVMPKPMHLRGKPGGRSIGMTSYAAEFITPGAGVKEGIRKKFKKYKNLDASYLVAVSVLDPIEDREGVMETLYGNLTINTDLKGNIWDSYNTEGLWGTGSNPKYTGVSGLLIFFNLFPWAFTNARSWLFLHPAAKKPYQGNLCRMNQAVINRNSGVLDWIQGETINSIFGFSENWPDH